MTAHLHDSFQCFPHVRGCSCEDRPNMLCNPYYVAEHCPGAWFEDEVEALEAQGAQACGWLSP